MRIKLTILFTFLFFLVQSQTYLQPEYDNLATKLSLTIGNGDGVDSLKGNTGTVVYFRYNSLLNFFNPTDSVEIQVTQNDLLGTGTTGIGVAQYNGDGEFQLLNISKDDILAGGKGVGIFRFEGPGTPYAGVMARRTDTLGLEATITVVTNFGVNEVVVADSFITMNIMDEATGVSIDSRDLSHPHINFSVYNADSSATYGMELHHHDDNFIFETTQGGYEFNTTGDIVITSPITPSLTRLLSIGADGKVDTALGNSGWTIDGAAVSNMSAGTGSLPDLTTGFANMAAGIEAGKGLTEANLCFFYGYDLTLSTPTSGSSIGIGSQFSIGSSSIAITNGGGGTFGNDAVCIGCVDAADGSVAIGAAGSSNVAQSAAVRGIALGAGADVASNDSNSIALGYDAATTTSHQLFLTDSVNSVSINAEIAYRCKTINTTAGDAATIDCPVGRFRKDATGAAFTLTNSYITANSIIQLTPANTAIDGTATTWTISAGAGTATITFNAAPTSNFDMNFTVDN